MNFDSRDWRWAFVVSAVLACLTQGTGGEGQLVQNDAPEKPGLSAEQAAQFAKKVAGQQFVGNLAPSLNAREAMDFLLTPALLTQQAVSDDVVFTYPAE